MFSTDNTDIYMYVTVDITPVPDRGFVFCATLSFRVCCVILTFLNYAHTFPPPLEVLGSKICFLHNILFSYKYIEASKQHLFYSFITLVQIKC